MVKKRNTAHLRGARTSVFIITGVVVAALAGCASTGGAYSLPTADGSGFGHVHGLGVDPTTGETYAATHNGVWLVPTGDLPDSYLNGAKPTTDAKPVQICGRAQDTMGFTVTTPGLLLASGHPDPTEQPDLNPPNLGLISSTDGAKTWETLSLRGETDFHDLAAAELPGGALRIYGYDATNATIRISIDSGKTWSSGATLELRDLAVDPANPDRLLATTADGLMVSNDSGRIFERVAGAPALFLIAATAMVATEGATSGVFVGIDTDGAIWKQGVERGSWCKTGQTEGTPEALGYAGGSAPWILFSDGRGIVASDDYGATATVLVPSWDPTP